MLPKFNRKENLHLIQDSMKKNLTIAMFKETNDGRSDHQPIWSIKDWKEVYLEIADPTEYLTAQYLIGDWDHWQMLTKSSVIRPIIEAWRIELKLKLKALAIQYLKEQAASDKGTAAAKWLATHGYEGNLPKASRAMRAIEESSVDILAHAKRMGTA